MPLADVFSLLEEKAESASAVGRLSRRENRRSETGLQRKEIINNRTVQRDSRVKRASGEEYQIERSFCNRCCTFLNSSKESVAEIKRKVDSSTDVVLGKDVFPLCNKPGFDGAFAMGLVFVLDQVNGDYVDDQGNEMDS